MSRSIFLSYSRHDAAPVEMLVSDLERAGHHVWLDRQLSGGQEWWDALLERIRVSDVFLPAVSERSLESTACRREREYASALGKQMLPVLVADDASLKLAPPELARIQWVDYRSSDKDAAFELIRALANLPPSPPMPETLPPAPEVPVSYLASIATVIDCAAPLAKEQQLDIIRKLRGGLDDSDNRAKTVELLGRLRNREDLLAYAANEIDDLLAVPAYTASSQVPVQAEGEFSEGPAFMSYSRLDTPTVLEIVKEVRERGAPIWIDVEDISVGTDWDRAIDEALERCATFVVFLTPAAVASQHVRDELAYAQDESKRILPLLIEDCRVPRRLRNIQYLDLRNRPLPADMLDRVATAMRKS